MKSQQEVLDMLRQLNTNSIVLNRTVTIEENAPLALAQLTIESKIETLSWVLEILTPKPGTVITMEPEKALTFMDSEVLQKIAQELNSALEPMTPYKMDPLEFCREAHTVKNEHINNALSLLPASIMEK